MIDRWRARFKMRKRNAAPGSILDQATPASTSGSRIGLTDHDLLLDPNSDAAFAELYDRYAAPILTYCQIRVSNIQDAEDVAAQVFVKAYRAFPPDDRGSFRSWLFTIAHHAVISWYRRNPTGRTSRPLDDQAAPALRDPGPLPEDIAMRNDNTRSLNQALATLTADQRQVIELRLAGLKGSEIATVIGRSESAVKMLQYRAMKCLRETLVYQTSQPTSTTHGREHIDAR